jgi:hypothetical protein
MAEFFSSQSPKRQFPNRVIGPANHHGHTTKAPRFGATTRQQGNIVSTPATL